VILDMISGWLSSTVLSVAATSKNVQSPAVRLLKFNSSGHQQQQF
jgi:hypothetical protein